MRDGTSAGATADQRREQRRRHGDRRQPHNLPAVARRDGVVDDPPEQQRRAAGRATRSTTMVARKPTVMIGRAEPTPRRGLRISVVDLAPRDVLGIVAEHPVRATHHAHWFGGYGPRVSGSTAAPTISGCAGSSSSLPPRSCSRRADRVTTAGARQPPAVHRRLVHRRLVQRRPRRLQPRRARSTGRRVPTRECGIECATLRPSRSTTRMRRRSDRPRAHAPACQQEVGARSGSMP